MIDPMKRRNKSGMKIYGPALLLVLALLIVLFIYNFGVRISVSTGWKA